MRRCSRSVQHPRSSISDGITPIETKRQASNPSLADVRVDLALNQTAFYEGSTERIIGGPESIWVP